MKAAVFAYSRQGCKTARRVKDFLDGEIRLFTMARFEEVGFASIERKLYRELFFQSDAYIFIGSCGIAVREIAPYVKDKRTDPAVLCIDELGQFVIPLLSGHIGGANELARQLADGLDATPVITTATDISNRFSVDAWAARNGCVISSMKAAKAVSAAILEADVPLNSDFPILTALPNGVIMGNSGDVGIYLTYKKKQPFTQTLCLIPKVLHLGIGCRKGKKSSAIREVVDMVFDGEGIDKRAIKSVATIDLKGREQGFLEYCQENNWPVSFYSAQQLKAVTGDFTPSEFVRSITGVDNVCERAALLGAERLIVKRTARNGVTVAVAEEHWEVYFG